MKKKHVKYGKKFRYLKKNSVFLSNIFTPKIAYLYRDTNSFQTLLISRLLKYFPFFAKINFSLRQIFRSKRISNRSEKSEIYTRSIQARTIDKKKRRRSHTVAQGARAKKGSQKRVRAYPRIDQRPMKRESLTIELYKKER